MIQYKLLVVNWSIFTLSVQLIYCASVQSTRDSAVTSTGGSTSITIAPIFKSAQTHQSLCQQDASPHLLSVDGRESSIILDLEPNRLQMGPCKRTFKAPEPHGFIVKLLKFKSKQMRNPNSHIDSNAGGVSIDSYNETTTCPLNIMTGKDPLTPSWKLDPCKMEAHGNYKEMVRLTEGLIRISWIPNHHSPKYKLLITTLGKGHHCNQGKGFHPCLKYGQETLFCVSSSLVCDGINHCPSSDEYNSDEDAAICSRQKGANDNSVANGMSIWQQITKELSKLYSSEVETNSNATMKASSKPTKVPHKPFPKETGNNETDESIDDNTSTDDDTESSTTKHYRHMTLSKGLSKYGPWGYLILGMLLCGGALLVCVLWECCKSDKEPFLNTLDSTNVTPITGSSANSNFNATQADSSLPPNYDEIDPPPSYATLFPGNKTYAPESSSTAPVTDQTARRSAEIVAQNPCTPQLPASLSVIVHTDGNALSTQSATALPSSSTQS